MAENSTDAPGGSRTPPYVSFRTFLTLLEDFKEHGQPPQIDPSVLKRFSGSAGAQIVGALKYLGYVDDQKKCLPLLKEAVDTYKTDQFAAHLQKVLLSAYPFLAALDLKTATPGMFADAFRKSFSAKEDVLRKSRTFYIHAASVADIELGPRLKSGGTTSAPANGSGGRKRGRPKAKVDQDHHIDDHKDERQSSDWKATQPIQKALEYQLIDLMSEPDIDDSVKQSIWSLVQYLMNRKTKKQTATATE